MLEECAVCLESAEDTVILQTYPAATLALSLSHSAPLPPPQLSPTWSPITPQATLTPRSRQPPSLPRGFRFAVSRARCRLRALAREAFVLARTCGRCAHTLCRECALSILVKAKPAPTAQCPHCRVPFGKADVRTASCSRSR